LHIIDIKYAFRLTGFVTSTNSQLASICLFVVATWFLRELFKTLLSVSQYIASLVLESVRL